ncbi:COG2605 Predicted kinase related to galactokinase and mevalonate kinase [Candidatus Methylopumilus universalis]|uniref:GHMP family kinase ATP-binding protein n=1 Tax=Candidatus Methylopumilus universalis TaxID=2588536 RepID=UPI003BEEE09F
MSEKKIIRARAPLRLGLAGGGSDVSPYSDIFGGYVLNATIDRFAYAFIESLDEPYVRFSALDQTNEITLSLEDSVELDGILNLHKATYNYFIKNYNNGIKIPLEIKTFCDAPAGSGLGSSSTVVVSIVKAFVEFLNLSLDDYLIAHIAYVIERIDCGLLGGKQDQYSATFGGFNFMEFNVGGKAIINPLKIKDWVLCELEASLLLFSTDISRDSAKIILDQTKNIESGSKKTIDAMHLVKKEAVIMKECLLKGDFDGIVQAMQSGWKNKKHSASLVSNAYLDSIYDACINAGAVSGKISGAGGGGFMLFFVPPKNRLDVIKTLQNFKGRVSNCHFTDNGAQSWRV